MRAAARSRRNGGRRGRRRERRRPSPLVEAQGGGAAGGSRAKRPTPRAAAKTPWRGAELAGAAGGAALGAISVGCALVLRARARARCHRVAHYARRDPAGAAPPAGEAGAAEAWRALDDAGDGGAPDGDAVSRLNGARSDALRRVGGAVTIVQGPPGHGQVELHLRGAAARAPRAARALCCCTTNKAVDSLVEEAGAADVGAVLPSAGPRPSMARPRAPATPARAARPTSASRAPERAARGDEPARARGGGARPLAKR